MSWNRLVSVDKNILFNTLNLESLDVSNNQLNSFMLENQNNFRRLLTLNLENNALQALEKQWQSEYPTLRLLNVSRNNIGPVIQGDELQYQKSFYGMVLDLSFNSIETVIMQDENKKNSTQDFQSIYLDLRGNPIKCDCTATNLKRAIEGKLSARYFHLISDQLDCAGGNSLQEIDYRNLNCPLHHVYQDQNCSEFNCSCILNLFSKEVSVNCSSSGLNQFPTDVLKLPNTEFSIKLDVSGNKIEQLPENINFRNYNNIKMLNLSRNNLGFVNHKLLPQDLNFLSIRSNKIRFLSEATVQFLESRINQTNFFMELGLNPYDCNCNAESLHNFVDSQYGNMVSDLSDVTIQCSSGALSLTKVLAEEFCKSIDKELMPIIASLATIVALMFFIVALVALNKNKILIFLYSKSWSRKFFHEDFIDKDKNFDVFISFSHEDREYVEGTLLAGDFIINSLKF